MNQLKLVAIANVIPRDATYIYIEQDEDWASFYSESCEARVVGYSELNRPTIDVEITHHRGPGWTSWWLATAKEHVYDT